MLRAKESPWERSAGSSSLSSRPRRSAWCGSRAARWPTWRAVWVSTSNLFSYLLGDSINFFDPLGERRGFPIPGPGRIVKEILDFLGGDPAGEFEMKDSDGDEIRDWQDPTPMGEPPEPPLYPPVPPCDPTQPLNCRKQPTASCLGEDTV